MISLGTETDRTLFFDFLPLDLGTVRGFRTRFHLYTVPGQVFYDASRKLMPVEYVRIGSSMKSRRPENSTMPSKQFSVCRLVRPSSDAFR